MSFLLNLARITVCLGLGCAVSLLLVVGLSLYPVVTGIGFAVALIVGLAALLTWVGVGR